MATGSAAAPAQAKETLSAKNNVAQKSRALTIASFFSIYFIWVPRISEFAMPWKPFHLFTPPDSATLSPERSC